ncbi:MAG: CD1871A family CXXC motif-containing protein [Desulfurivibrionaceae bacterium]
MVKKRKNRNRVRKEPFIVIAFFLFIWFIGISSDEPVRVLEQAVRICLSCIGIG